MKDTRTEMYREYTGWPTWVLVLVAVAMASTTIPVVLGVDDAAGWSTATRSIYLLGILSFWGLLLLFFGGLLVTVERDGIRVGLGRVRILKTFIPFASVASLEAVTYRPIRDFGGWGLRGSARKRAWTSRGNEAVRIILKDGREVYIGSDRPQALVTRIRNGMSLAGFSV